MDGIDFLHLSLLFRCLMVLFLAHTAWLLYRLQNNFWKAPALLAVVYLCWTWVNIPLLFRMNLSYDYQVMHAVFMLTANALRIRVVHYLPGPTVKTASSPNRRVFLWGSLVAVYGILLVFVVSKLGFAPALSDPEVSRFYQWVDFASTSVSMVLYSFFLYRSYGYLWPQPADNRLFGLVLLTANLLTFYLMSSTLFSKEPVFTPWLKLASFSLFFLWLAVQFWYFQSLSLFFRVNSVSTEVVAQANKLEVQSTVGVHLIWKQGVYKIGIKVLKTDGSSKWHWVERNKLNKTLGHWLAFAVATKGQEQLTHGDMNVIKFRMLELWNKASDQVLQQKHVFEGQRGAYGFICQPAQVFLELDLDLRTNTLLKDALLDFDHVWIATDAFKNAQLGKSKVRMEENRWVELLLQNFTK